MKSFALPIVTCLAWSADLPFAAAQSAGRAHFEIRVPAEATVEVEGKEFPRSGEVRSFTSPPLADGAKYAYDFKATFQGRSASRRVFFKSGDRLIVNFVDDLSLWKRLGGNERMGAVVDDLISRIAKDPEVNFDRNGAIRLDAEGVKDFRRRLLDSLRAIADGKKDSQAERLKTIHQRLNVTDAEWTAFMGHFRAAMQRGKVGPESEAFVAQVDAIRSRIVSRQSP